MFKKNQIKLTKYFFTALCSFGCLFSLSASAQDFAGQDKSNHSDIPKISSTKPPFEITHQVILFDHEIPVAGYVYLNNKPLINITEVQDATGLRQMQVVSNEQAEKIESLLSAISPNYPAGSAFAEVVVLTGSADSEKNKQIKEVVVADFSAAGLQLTEPGFIGRKIVNVNDRLKTIKSTKALSAAQKQKVFVKSGVSRYTLADRENGHGLQVGDIIEIKKPASENNS